MNKIQKKLTSMIKTRDTIIILWDRRHNYTNKIYNLKGILCMFFA